jgi:transcriptional regulator with XRE-family HTH domain
MKNNIHIGSLIRQKVKEQGLRNRDFAKAICCSDPNVSSIFKRKSIDIDQLQLISEVLGYNFLELYLEKDVSKKCTLIIEVDKQKFNEIVSDSSINIIRILEK